MLDISVKLSVLREQFEALRAQINQGAVWSEDDVQRIAKSLETLKKVGGERQRVPLASLESRFNAFQLEAREICATRVSELIQSDAAQLVRPEVEAEALMWLERLARRDQVRALQLREQLTRALGQAHGDRLLTEASEVVAERWRDAQAPMFSGPDVLKAHRDAVDTARRCLADARRLKAADASTRKLEQLTKDAEREFNRMRIAHEEVPTNQLSFTNQQIVEMLRKIKSEHPEETVTYLVNGQEQLVPVDQALRLAEADLEKYVTEKIKEYMTTANMKLALPGPDWDYSTQPRPPSDPEGAWADLEQIWKIGLAPTPEFVMDEQRWPVGINLNLRIDLRDLIQAIQTELPRLQTARNRLSSAMSSSPEEGWRLLGELARAYPEYRHLEPWPSSQATILAHYISYLDDQLNSARSSLRHGNDGAIAMVQKVVDLAVSDPRLAKIADSARQMANAIVAMEQAIEDADAALKSRSETAVRAALGVVEQSRARNELLGFGDAEVLNAVRMHLQSIVEADEFFDRLRRDAASSKAEVLAIAIADSDTAQPTIPTERRKALVEVRALLAARQALILGIQSFAIGDLDAARKQLEAARSHPDVAIDAAAELVKVEDTAATDFEVRTALDRALDQSACDAFDILDPFRDRPTTLSDELRRRLATAKLDCGNNLERELRGIVDSGDLPSMDDTERLVNRFKLISAERENASRVLLAPLLADHRGFRSFRAQRFGEAREHWAEAALIAPDKYRPLLLASTKLYLLSVAELFPDEPSLLLQHLEKEAGSEFAQDPDLLLARAEARALSVFKRALTPEDVEAARAGEQIMRAIQDCSSAKRAAENWLNGLPEYETTLRDLLERTDEPDAAARALAVRAVETERSIDTLRWTLTKVRSIVGAMHAGESGSVGEFTRILNALRNREAMLARFDEHGQSELATGKIRLHFEIWWQARVADIVLRHEDILLGNDLHGR